MRFACLTPILALVALPLFASTASATPSASDNVSVTRLVLAHGVEAREPQTPSTTFDSKDDRVYAFVEIDNKSKSEQTINVVFEPPTGPAFAEIPLKVGDARHFRTWAFTRRAHEKGDWAVIVRSGDKVLGRQTFTVK